MLQVDVLISVKTSYRNIPGSEIAALQPARNRSLKPSSTECNLNEDYNNLINKYVNKKEKKNIQTSLQPLHSVRK